MSESNGNVLKYQVEELLQWKKDQTAFFNKVIQPFLDKTNKITDFVEDNRQDIKDLNLMKEQINNINEKMNKQEQHRRQMMYLIWGAAISGIAGLLFQVLKSL